jgi:hypothetical protein
VKSFVLLDLASQAVEVGRYTEGWAPADILAWMRCYGTVIDWSWKEPDFYVFYAPTGLYTGFHLSGEEFTIFGFGKTQVIRRRS